MHADKSKEKKSQSPEKKLSQEKSTASSTFQFEDNRPESIQMAKLQGVANNNFQAQKIAQFQTMANSNSPQHWPIQKKENNTGLPDNLKAGIENLSGYSMDDVKVHRNSDKPAQLNAHAYAQGTDIHLASGQEKHLPHEAWHVVQQKQGRVKPTLQMKGQVSINDDDALEKEADMMGVMALQAKFKADSIASVQDITPVIQRITWKKKKTGWTPLYGDETDDSPPGMHFGEIGQVYVDESDTLYDASDFEEQIEGPQVEAIHEQLNEIEGAISELMQQIGIEEYLSPEYEMEVLAYLVFKNMSVQTRSLLISYGALDTGLELFNKVVNATLKKQMIESNRELIEKFIPQENYLVLDRVGLFLSEFDPNELPVKVGQQCRRLQQTRDALLQELETLENFQTDSIPRKCKYINSKISELEKQTGAFEDHPYFRESNQTKKKDTGEKDPVKITGTLGVMTEKAFNSIPSPFNNEVIIRHGLSRICAPHGEEGIHIRTNGVVVYKFLGTIGNKGIYANLQKNSDGLYVFSKKLTRRH